VVLEETHPKAETLQALDGVLRDDLRTRILLFAGDGIKDLAEKYIAGTRVVDATVRETGLVALKLRPLTGGGEIRRNVGQKIKGGLTHLDRSRNLCAI